MGNTNSTEENNGTPQRRRPQGQNPNGLNVVGAVVGGIAVAGAAYAAYRFAQSDDSALDQRASSSPSFANNRTADSDPDSDLEDCPSKITVIAADATATRGGGLLVMHSKKEVCYYSLNWSSRLRFPEASHMFEMTNAFIAMTVWKSLFETKGVARNEMETIVIKVDNTVFNRQKVKPRDTYWNSIDSLRREIGGHWVPSYAKTDKEFYIADVLSRGNTVLWSEKYPDYEGWTICCVDRIAENVMEDLIREGKIPPNLVWPA